MKTNAVDPEDDRMPDDASAAAEPAKILWRLFLAALKGEVTRKQALERAARRELAQAVTPDTIPVLAQALAKVEEIGEAKNTEFFADLLMKFADTLQNYSGLNPSLDLYNVVESVYRRLGCESDVARCAMDRANTLQEMGRNAEALAGYEAAERTYRKHALELDVAGCRMNRAIALQEIGRYAAAAAGFDAAEPVFQKHGLEWGVALCRMNRAIALQEMGRFTESVAGYDNAEALFQKHGLEIDVAHCRLNRANTLVAMGRNAEALAGYEAAERTYRKHALELGVAGCRMNRAIALGRMGRHGEAVAGYDAAEPVFLKRGQEIDAASCRMNRADTLQKMGRYAEAEASLQDLPFLHFSPADRMRYHSVRGGILFHLGRQDEALKHFGQVRSLFRHAHRHGGLDERHLDFAGSFQSIIRKPVHFALRAGQTEWAYDAVQDAKATVAGDLFRQRSARSDREPAPVALRRKHMTDCLRGHFDQAARDPVPAAEVRRAPTPHEQQQTEEAIADFFRTWQAERAAPAPSPVPLEAESRFVRNAIQQALAPGWALLDFWKFDERELKVFVLTPDRFRVETLENPLQHEEFVALANGWLSAVNSGSETGLDDGVLDYLDAFLFDPLRKRGVLDGILGLYLVPHDYLHLLPLHAARRQDERTDPRFLCDDFLISYLPSAALLPELPAPDWRGRVHSLANPEEGTRHTLPFSQWEGRQLQPRYPDARLHVGKTGTWERAAEWDDAALVHFSCHGSGHPAFAPLSHLRLADDLLLAHDVLYRTPPLRPGALVVLNGCQTGAHDLRAVDEGMGLMTAFLLRGAGLVCSTGWPVQDPVAAEMVLAFLAALDRPGVSAPEALRAAQWAGRNLTAETVEQQRRELLEKHFPEETHPYEAAKLMKQGVRYLLSVERRDEARELGIRCARLLKQLGEEVEAAAVREVGDRAPVVPYHARPYRSPLYWSAFHLVGRVV